MRAVAYLMLVPIEDPQSLVDIEVERQRPSGRTEAASLRQAHATGETGGAIGKIVLAGFR